LISPKEVPVPSDVTVVYVLKWLAMLPIGFFVLWWRARKKRRPLEITSEISLERSATGAIQIERGTPSPVSEDEGEVLEAEPEPAERTMPSSDPPEPLDEAPPAQSVHRECAPRRSRKPTAGSVRVPVEDLRRLRALLMRLRTMIPAGGARQLVSQCLQWINQHIASDEEIVAASLKRPFWRRAG
jgi:hypothetical protein